MQYDISTCGCQNHSWMEAPTVRSWPHLALFIRRHMPVSTLALLLVCLAAGHSNWLIRSSHWCHLAIYFTCWECSVEGATSSQPEHINGLSTVPPFCKSYTLERRSFGWREQLPQNQCHPPRERGHEQPPKYHPSDLDLRLFVKELAKSFGHERGASPLPCTPGMLPKKH